MLRGMQQVSSSHVAKEIASLLTFCNTLQKCLGKTRLPLTSIGKRFIVPECSLGSDNPVGIDVNATPELRSEAAEEID